MKQVGYRGFTLVEMVVTIVVIAVLALGVTSFITYGMQIYKTSTAWQQQMSQLRLASQRFTAEVGQAVPGTVRVWPETDVNGDSIALGCITFRPLESAERLLANPLVGTTDHIVSYLPNCCSTSDCSGCSATEVALFDGYQPYFYSINSANISSCGTDCSLAELELSGTIEPATYSSNDRFFMARPMVEWCVVGEQIRRNNVLMGEGLTNDLGVCANSVAGDPQCPFVSEPPALGRNNLVRLQWWFAVDGQQQRWVQEVQLANVP
ncbi:PulJ/GspJ family protein [Ferrimonas lipolytica]|uniref:Type II secretion system protein n=1 Tax=Ferrimonas lipolytica TaxID=2724191 RepID=A0A6H1UFT8_9GAMM|nr:type II secretion system protein [Ferrimonas lipolytica]QIZ77914.1 type II secretion system protein [Ferrimonas lipolytica]